jgi:predicted nucleic acid-binding protein
MIAVSDTSPICYLILIGEIGLLQKLFDQVLAPQAVFAELCHEDAPDAVRYWASNLPTWINVQESPRGSRDRHGEVTVRRKGVDTLGRICWR